MCSKALGLILALLVICCAIRPQQAWEVPDVVKKQVKKLHGRCMTKTGVSEEIMTEAHKGNLPTDPSFKCFLHCMFEMFGLIDADNTMHLEVLVEVLPTEIHDPIMKLAEACGTKMGVDGCDTAYQTVKCYFETDGPFIKAAVDDLLG